jgi:hypothetical protein
MSEKITEKIKPIMGAMVKMTKKDGIEHGFVLCDNYIIKGGKGSKDSIVIEPCQGVTSLSFHTHPSGQNYPSNTDILEWRKRNVRIACIGTKNLINCFYFDE